MGKKKRRKAEEEAIRNHEQHHQSVHDYIMGQLPVDKHVMPKAQPWHMPAPWCWCVPTRDDVNPMTGETLWIHNVTIH